MSWLQKLHETYEFSKGREPEGAKPLMPISHTTQQAQIEIVLDAHGNFRRATVLDRTNSTTLIPCSEDSGGRAGSKPTSHPLCDKLQYLAADFVQFGGEVTSGFAKAPSEPHRQYFSLLSSWADSAQAHPKLTAIRSYVSRGQVMSDLIAHQVLPIDEMRQLVKEWRGEKEQAPAIYKWLQAGQYPEEAFVRWSVEGEGLASGTWQDDALINSWIDHYATLQASRGLCMVQGDVTTLATQHPAKLRNAGDKAKLISTNDDSGFTFRGRFLESAEAVSVGFKVTQKAHNALRWLIERQGSRNGTQAVVAWTPSAVEVPDPMASTYELLGFSSVQVPIASGGGGGNVGQAFSLQLKKAIQGYRARLEPGDGIVVMGLDSATPGRMAITYYREIQGSEFLGRIEAWHTRFAWPQNYSKDKKFIGSPSPRDIAQAAYGRRLDEKLEKSVRERLLPCIVDGAAIPTDLVEAVRRRAANRVGFKKDEWWEWEKCLGIACALFKGKYAERNYDMALETERTSRDYLYGRLLAIAESLESFALKQADEQRETTAARLMQRFADRPSSTWRTIELALSPYLVRLGSRAPGFLVSRKQLLDDVVASFHHDDFVLDAPLTGEFLLGYHCQRQVLLNGSDKSDGKKAATDD